MIETGTCGVNKEEKETEKKGKGVSLESKPQICFLDTKTKWEKYILF